MILGRSIGGAEEPVIVTTLAEVEPGQADRRRVMSIGSSQTRIIEVAGGALVSAKGEV